ncbi:MGMT family protein [Bacillus sp. V2I10]|jgi:methylated-DNA-protein-cysteine methyltransferase-like protein|uniref:MGMT family protein n=1 Tax=Bacillus sp. V2I10 TaxID=3042276 RepID=UPI00277D6C84|nr:MGMT family protein [Bacillus sp. V2I10]MDQ0860501.1 methylated-DNA-protein-cysteine methyltransferase-like protein [Bacillus sp. V2I10]
METFTQRALLIIRSIPAGKVMTYGQVARCAGQPRGARQVVRILHSMSEKHRLPWHRVINSKGEIGMKETEAGRLQKKLLEEEGISFIGEYRIHLEDWIYDPGMDAADW